MDDIDLLADRAAAERENTRLLRYAMTIYCTCGNPAQHHEDCPRFPARWASTLPGPSAPVLVDPAGEQLVTVDMGADQAVGQVLADLADAKAGDRLLAGTFAFYSDGAGGLVCVSQFEGDPNVQRRHIPARLMRFSMGLIGNMVGGRRGGGLVGRMFRAIGS